jgi:caspase domain-containing protein
MRNALLLAALALTLPASAQQLRRLALIAGNDDGGRDTRPLVYATTDAKKVHEILLQLGGVRSEDARLLLNARPQELLGALAELEARSAEARRRGERTALLVYFSGHAKDGALRLGDGALPLDALKARLAAAPADIRLGIFDACRSGAVVRTKGVRRAPAFEVQSDAQADAQGMVILTSSASDEDSQESDGIAGSYFTHHLVSGLRGDADRSGDGRVSLSEAYAYAYDRTVADTAESAAGAQHPTFSYDLAGNGDLVLTEVSSRREGLRFPAEAPQGVYYLVDGRGRVVAEVFKEAGAERKIVLSPGKYRVKRRLEDRLRIGEVEVQGGAISTMDESRLRDAPFSDDPVKGDSRTTWSVGLAVAYQGFFGYQNYFPPSTSVGLELQLHHYFRANWMLDFDAALGGGKGEVPLTTISGTAPYQFSQLALGSSIVTQWPMGDLVPFAGVRLSFMVLGRQFDPAIYAKSFQGMFTWSPGAVVGVKWNFAGGWHAVARLRLQYLNYDIDENRHFGFGELGGMVGYAF